MARNLAVVNQKGGVGKTATAANLAAAWGEGGRRVLAIDLDAQFDLTRAFGCAPSQAPATAVEVIAGTTDLADAVISAVAPGVDLLAGHRALADVELSLVPQPKREERLALALRGAAYDLVLIDCRPNLGLLTINALFAAPELVVPVSMEDPSALQGVGELMLTLERLAELDVSVRIAALVRTHASPRHVMYQAIDEQLEGLGVPIARTEIPLRRAPFGRSAAEGRPLVVSAPDSAPAIAYRQLAAELEQPRLRAVA